MVDRAIHQLVLPQHTGPAAEHAGGARSAEGVGVSADAGGAVALALQVAIYSDLLCRAAADVGNGDGATGRPATWATRSIGHDHSRTRSITVGLDDQPLGNVIDVNALVAARQG